MSPFPETTALIAQRGPAALHLAGWFAPSSFLLLLAAMGDERRRSGLRPGLEPAARRRCP